MSDPNSEFPTPEEVERRLSELEELYELGMALKEVRFTDQASPDRVRERPGTNPPGKEGSGPSQSSV